ncbi:MAG: L-threonylcarbamoyladenylate synthase [Candidatus Woesearchaeota archaeon]
MRVLDRTEFERFKHIHVGKIKQGSLFIYPTDTIYGLGCDATNGESIKRIRKIKQREDQPFSIIAPSKDWILENCIVNEEGAKWLDKLPGPYTFVFELKNKDALHKHVNPQNNTIGVRIPDHWSADIAKHLGKPIVTTSPNVHGEDVMTHPEELNPEFMAHLDFVLYEGRLHNPPSAVIRLTDSEANFLRTREANQHN